jgi:hypothetical protein
VFPSFSSESRKKRAERFDRIAAFAAGTVNGGSEIRLGESYGRTKMNRIIDLRE